MTTCPICDIITKKTGLIYEDEKTIAFIPQNSMTPGHIVLTSKQHYPILEQIPDYIIDKLFITANKLSISIFERLGAEGTNIIANTGPGAGQVYPHAMIHIIPRKQNDGLKLEWNPKKISDEEMNTTELKLKEVTGIIGQFDTEPEKPIEIEPPKELPTETETEENYLTKQIQRIP